MPFTAFPSEGPYSPSELTSDLNDNFNDAQTQLNALDGRLDTAEATLLTKANIANPTFTGRITTPLVVVNQAAPVSLSVASTITGVQLTNGIIEYTGAVADLTLPTGTDIEAAFTPALTTDNAFDFSVINTGTGAATLLVNTGVTIVGSAVVTNGTSARFRVRETALNTFVVYRMS